jgi:hypothetical protein
MSLTRRPGIGGGAVVTETCPFCGMPKEEMNGNNLPAHLRRECKEVR